MSDSAGIILLFLAALILITVAIAARSILAHGSKTPGDFPYERVNALFSPAERSFLGVLDQALGDQFRVMGKVRLADVISVRRGLGRSAWQSAFNQIQSKHLDFIVCDPDNLSVLFVLELDDNTHEQARRKDRDAFVASALTAAGIPLHRFPARRAYSVSEIRATLMPAGDQGENLL
jgi:hypothetical protein